jgi:hypothetical protein
MEMSMPKKANSKQEVIKLLLLEQEELASFGVVGLGLFGSFARDEQTSSSNIDILVEFAPEKHTFDNFTYKTQGSSRLISRFGLG